MEYSRIAISDDAVSRALDELLMRGDYKRINPNEELETVIKDVLDIGLNGPKHIDEEYEHGASVPPDILEEEKIKKSILYDPNVKPFRGGDPVFARMAKQGGDS